MQTERITIGAKFRIRHSVKQFLEIVDTALTTSIVVIPAPAAVVEPSTRSIHHTMQTYDISVGILQVFTIHMEWRCVTKSLVLCKPLSSK